MGPGPKVSKPATAVLVISLGAWAQGPEAGKQGLAVLKVSLRDWGPGPRNGPRAWRSEAVLIVSLGV